MPNNGILIQLLNFAAESCRRQENAPRRFCHLRPGKRWLWVDFFFLLNLTH